MNLTSVDRTDSTGQTGTTPGPEYLGRPEIVGVVSRRTRWLAGVMLAGVAMALTVATVVAFAAALVIGAIGLLVALYLLAVFSKSRTNRPAAIRRGA